MIVIIFGKPRAGKTTYLVKLAQQNLRAYQKSKGKKGYKTIYCNDPTVSGTVYVSTKEMGAYPVDRRTAYFIDEAGIELSNRDWKSLPFYQRAFAALHGHRDVDVYLFSQVADIDISFRNRAHDFYLIEQCKFLKGRSRVKHINYSIDVDNETHELKECYSCPESLFERMVAHLTGDIFTFRRKPYYKLFDSYIDDPKNYAAPSRDEFLALTTGSGHRAQQ